MKDKAISQSKHSGLNDCKLPSDLGPETEKEMLLKGIELYGSKRQLAQKLGYLGKYGGSASHINRVLQGRGHLPKWRLERLELLLKREAWKTRANKKRGVGQPGPGH